MMRLGHLAFIPAFTALCVAVGCRTPLSQAPIGAARAVSDISGVNNLSRDGDMYFAGQPTRKGLATLAERGVKTIINLRPEGEMVKRVDFDELRAVAALGMEYVTIPLTLDTFDAGDTDRLDEILRVRSGGVLMHCGSSNRVGALWALYLYRHRGLQMEDALTKGRHAGLRAPALIEVIKREADK